MLDCTSITFERTTAEDAAALLDLETRVGVPRIYEPRVKIEDAIKEIQENTFYFIKHRDRIIGSASFRVQADGSAYIGNMAVDPIYRHQGIALATMNFLIGQLEDAVRLELVTHTENDPALRLYKSLGFKIEAEISNYFGDGEPRVKLVRSSTSSGATIANRPPASPQLAAVHESRSGTHSPSRTPEIADVRKSGRRDVS